MEHTIIIVLLIFLVILVLGIIYLKDLLTSVVLLSIYSFVAAAIFLVMDAVDVAFTEATVGAGISSILLLGTLRLTWGGEVLCLRKSSSQKIHSLFALFIVCITGSLLIYGTLDMPHYGDIQNIAYQHSELAQHYIYKSKHEIGIPNVVTSVLASYRGYDTLGETAVVFSAAIAVLSLLGLGRHREDEFDLDK